ncbi:MAG: DMT family transporter [Pseudomonadales bacterium]
MQRISYYHVFLLILLSFIWGSSFSAIKLAVDELTPLQIAFARVLFAALTLWASSLIFTLNWPRKAYNWGILCAIALFSSALPFSLISWASEREDSSTVSILMASAPIFAVLVSHFFTGDEELNRYKTLGVVLGFCGVLILLVPDLNFSAKGTASAKIATLLAALSYVISGVLTRKLTETLSAQSIATFVLSISTLILGAALLFEPATLPSSLSETSMIAIVYLGIIATAIAQLLRYSLILQVGYSFVSYIGFLIPVFALLIGVLWLDESLSLLSLCALALVLIALALAKLGGNR